MNYLCILGVEVEQQELLATTRRWCGLIHTPSAVVWPYVAVVRQSTPAITDHLVIILANLFTEQEVLLRLVQLEPRPTMGFAHNIFIFLFFKSIALIINPASVRIENKH